MVHEVLGHLLQSLRAREQDVLPREVLLDGLAVVVAERVVLRGALHRRVEVGGRELQIRDRGLKEQRHRGAVFDGLKEGVARDVVAELLAGGGVGVDQGRAREGHEGRAREGRAHG